MFGFFESLFKWFYDKKDEGNSSNSAQSGIFEDQKKVQFDILNKYNNHSRHPKYVTRETQTYASFKKEKKSCEVMTDKVDFPLSQFDTEPIKRKDTKGTKHSKYGFKDPVKMDEDFKFEFVFHNIDKPKTTNKQRISTIKFRNNVEDNSDDNNQVSNDDIVKAETNTDDNNSQSEKPSHSSQESKRQSDTETQQKSDVKSETESQQETEVKSETDNQTETENPTEYDDDDIGEEEEEEDYDTQS